jgi:GNAT superfamily N-acetyltransferase
VFQVKKMEPQDLEFAVELANKMDWNMTAQDFEFNMQLEPEGCFILLDNAERTGLATCVSYGEIGWFGNLVVEEGKRSRGAGANLVNHAAKYLRSKGVATVGLYAYPYLEKFYDKLGFSRHDDFMVLKANAVQAPSIRDKNPKPITEKNLSLLADRDCNCFGACRKKLLKLLFENPANIGYVAFEDSEVVGFAAAKVFGEAAEIGPLVCTRSRPDLAVNLLKAVLSRLCGLEAYIYLPVAETTLLDTAFELGFQKKFGLTRMFSGPAVAKTCIYSAESLERG